MLLVSFFYIRGGRSRGSSKIYLTLFIFGITLFLFLAFSKGISSQAPVIEDKVQLLSKKSEIYNLRVESDEQFAYVLLKWQVRSTNTSPIIVKRYSRPMSTVRLLQKGERLNSKSLEPQTTSYRDTLVSPGVYYYAVVTEEELNTSERLVLVERENYTHRPFIVTESSKPTELNLVKKEKNYPQELIAINMKKSVLLSWLPLSTYSKDLSYELYRSFKPLDAKEALKKAQLLGKTKGARPQFEDTKPIANKDVYYAVIISGALEWPNFKALELGQSYIKHRYIRDVVETGRLFASNIRNAVLLTWSERGDSAKTRYRIYRSYRPLDSKEALESAELLGATKGHHTKFKDENPIIDKDVYYGLIRLEEGGEAELKGLILNKSYIKHRFTQGKDRAIVDLFKKHPDSNKALDIILANSYLKNQYRKCIRQVNIFLIHARMDEDTEAKGNFFLGLCYYKRKSYREAMEFFSVPLVKKKYPMRSRFWFERSVRRP